ncbi:MAG: squalene synthase HpnC [Mariprofundaceae bacterium]
MLEQLSEQPSGHSVQKPKLTIEQAYQHCQQIAQDHYENFPTASKLISKKLRPAVAAIYAFARAADDMADEGNAPADKRLKQLDAWESLLDRCVKEELDHPVFLALGDAIRRFELPTSALYDLLIAFRMDVSIHSYSTPDELLFYCKHSANPVGRLMLALHGVSDASALRYSDAICTALQLTNFWQDLKVDIPNGRCYLANTWLETSGLDSEKVLAGDVSFEELKPAFEHAISYTQNLFNQGHALLPYLPWRFRFQIAATLYGGQAILKATSKLKNPMVERPHLKRSDWIRLAGRIVKTALIPSKRPPMGTT